MPVLLGRRPVVMDPFAFRVLAERGRVNDRPLAGRIARREFDVLVLMGAWTSPARGCVRIFISGRAVTAAMREAYRFDRQLGPYYLFVPAEEDRGSGREGDGNKDCPRRPRPE